MQKHTEAENFLQLSGKFRLNFSHLLRVPKLMRCNHFHPFVHVQHPQKRVPPAVGPQISPLCLLNKRHRTLAHSAQPRQHGLFFPRRLSSSGTGDLRRITRASTSHNGRCMRLGKGTGIAAFCVNRSTFVTTPRSTTTRCATNCAADHSFTPGQSPHFSSGIASAARKKAVCARPSFSRIGWSDVIRTTSRSKLLPRRPLQTHAPTAAPAPRQTPARKSAAPPAASRKFSRTALKSPATPPGTP